MVRINRPRITKATFFLSWRKRSWYYLDGQDPSHLDRDDIFSLPRIYIGYQLFPEENVRLHRDAYYFSLEAVQKLSQTVGIISK